MSKYESISQIDFGREAPHIKSICDIADSIIENDVADDIGVSVSNVDVASGKLKLTFYGYDFEPFFNKDDVDYLVSQANKIVFRGGDKLYIDFYFKFKVNE